MTLWSHAKLVKKKIKAKVELRKYVLSIHKVLDKIPSMHIAFTIIITLAPDPIPIL